MSGTDHIYVRDRKYPCPRPKVAMSQTESVYVPDRVSMSQAESVYVPDRECRCPRQKNIDSANTKQAITRAPDLRWR